MCRALRKTQRQMTMDRRPISTSMSRCLGYTAPRRASGLLVSVRTIGVSAHHSRSNTREEAASCRRQSMCQSRIKLEWRSNEALTAMLQIFRCDPFEFLKLATNVYLPTSSNSTRYSPAYTPFRRFHSASLCGTSQWSSENCRFRNPVHRV